MSGGGEVLHWSCCGAVLSGIRRGAILPGSGHVDVSCIGVFNKYIDRYVLTCCRSSWYTKQEVYYFSPPVGPSVKATG